MPGRSTPEELAAGHLDGSDEPAGGVEVGDRSAPAQNARPTPVSTTARTEASSATRSSSDNSASMGGTVTVLGFFPALAKRLDLAAGMLSGGEQQMLAIGRALMQGPKVLLIDELSMGLAPVIVQGLLPIVRQVADETGAAVILVEQHVHLALGIAEHAVVMVHGGIALRGPAKELLAAPSRLEQAYLGG